MMRIVPIGTNNKGENAMSDNRLTNDRNAEVRTAGEPGQEPKKLYCTMTHMLYMMLGACLLKRTKKVQKDLQNLVEVAEAMVRGWEETKDEIEESLGHDNFCLLELDIFEDGSTAPRWELREERGQYEGRLYVRFLPRKERKAEAASEA